MKIDSIASKLSSLDQPLLAKVAKENSSFSMMNSLVDELKRSDMWTTKAFYMPKKPDLVTVEPFIKYSSEY